MSSPSLIVPSPTLNKLAPDVPNNILRNAPLCYFASFLIVLLTSFINKPDSSSDLTIFIISIISSLKVINVVTHDPNIFLWIAASAADTAVVNPYGIKTLASSGLSTLFIKVNPAFSNDPKSLPKNPPHYPILCNWVFDNFILAEELFAKAFRSFETCVLVNNN